MPDERWLPVVGFEGCYEVSDQGRVRSLARTIIRKNGMKLVVKPRILKPHRSGSSKGRRLHVAVLLSGHDGSQTHPQIHTLVLTAFAGLRPPNLQCRHLNGDAKDNRLINLIWGTAKENYEDSVRHGTAYIGLFGLGKKHAAKLREVDIPIIRAAYASGVKGVVLARQYSVGRGAISAIIRGRSWRDIPVTATNLDLFGNEQT